MPESLKSAEAGHWGNDIRSDLHVAIEPRDSGGIEIGLESRVGLYYGSSILAQAGEVLDALGVKHAKVSIHDEGALPFVISARIEAAVKRAGLGDGKKSLPEKVALPQPSSRDRLRRSRLYLPGSEPKYFINAGLPLMPEAKPGFRGSGGAWVSAEGRRAAGLPGLPGLRFPAVAV